MSEETENKKTEEDNNLKNETELEDDLEDEEEYEEEDESGNSRSSYEFPIKIGAIFAAVAIFIVLIVGIFSGITFWTILVRMVISGLIFFALGFGVGFLIKMFIPEIDELNGGEEYSPGDNVDYITEDDDNEENEGEENKEYLDNFFEGDKNTSKKMGTLGGEASDYNIPDDPKMLADAVRTVIKRDE